MFHDLKSWPEQFQAAWDGRKRFELRRDDRPFKAGDTLRLREYDPERKDYTGRTLSADISYLVRPDRKNPAPIPAGFVLMSLTAPLGKQRH